MRRKSDSNEKVRFFRMGDRISVINGEWFVTTREGVEGPYKSREHAEGCLMRMIENWETAEGLLEHREKLAQESEQQKPKLDTSIWDRQITIS